MKNILLILMAIPILAGFTACNPTTPPITTSPTAISSGPYPAGNQPTNSTYPAPQATAAVEVSQITPDPSMGTVKGTLQLNGEAVPSAIVYLATTVKNAENKEVAAALDRSIAPTAVTNNDGFFAFINVTANRYALMYQAGPDTYVLFYPDRTEAILVEITGSENIDLGLLNYEDLPK